MGTPHLRPLCWPSNDEHWEPLARQLADAVKPGERLSPAKMHDAASQRLGWPRLRSIAVLPAAEMLGLLRYLRSPNEEVGTWVRSR